jgi:aryl-alcohol dehydrogenase-like predicted oxidoreductase
MKALGVAERHGFDRFVSQQIYYSVLNREAEHELLPASVEEGLGNLIWSPLAGGLLTGKYRRDAPTPRVGRHLSDWREPPISDWEHVYDVVDAIVAVADSRGVTPAGSPFLFAWYTWSHIADCRRAHRDPAEGQLGNVRGGARARRT